MAKTILILAANPKNTSHLRLDQEVREIEDGLQRSQNRSEFVLKQKWATRPKDIRRAMLDCKPNMVHFCGHGSGEDGIVFEDDNGQAKLVSADTLAGFFELFSDKVECVILNACYSDVQARAIVKHIPYVIGVNKAIGDDVAIEFAVAFYDSLGAGKSVDFAYKLACNAMQWLEVRDYQVQLHISDAQLAKSNEWWRPRNISPVPNNDLITEAKEYRDYIEGIVNSLSISSEGKIYREKEYGGTRQPGQYKIDISLEVNIDEMLSLLIIVDCKNWKSIVDREAIQTLTQTRDAISAHKAICVSQFGFSQEAIEVAKSQGIGLWMFAKGQFTSYAGGGLAAMSIGREMASIFSEFLHKEIMYNGSYSHNLVTDYGYPVVRRITPNLVPFEWVTNRDSGNRSNITPEYESSIFAHKTDPLMKEIMQYVVDHIESGSSLSKRVKHFLSGYLAILTKAGVPNSLAKEFLDEIVRISIKDGLPFVKGNGHWQDIETFEKKMNHKATPLIAPIHWLEKNGERFFIYASNPPEHFTSVEKNIIWANVAWLLDSWKKANQI